MRTLLTLLRNRSEGKGLNSSGMLAVGGTDVLKIERGGSSVEVRRRPWLVDHALENPLDVSADGGGVGAGWPDLAPIGAGVWDFSGGTPTMLGRADDPDNPFNAPPPISREFVVMRPAATPSCLVCRRAAPRRDSEPR